MDIEVLIVNLRQSYRQLQYQGPSLWNAICSSPTICINIADAPTLPCLKARLKRLFIVMQGHGDTTEWLKANKNLKDYLIAIKTDPYTTTSTTDQN